MIEYFLHLDEYLFSFVESYGALVYFLIFGIIFAETGLVIAPFLPGDSLLFAAGAIAGIGHLNIYALLILLTGAAILGDSVNYLIGYKIGPKVFREREGKIFNKKHLITTQEFYDRNGAVTIVLARFIPIVRTFAPFVAGIGKMNYGKFIFYNIAGAVAWCGIFVLGGFFFGNIPLVKNNFEIVILGIIFVSVLPIIIKALKSWMKKR